MDEERARFLLAYWIGLSVRTEKVLAGGADAGELLAEEARTKTWNVLEPPAPTTEPAEVDR